MDIKTYAIVAMVIGFGLIAVTFSLGIYIAKKRVVAK